MTVTESVHHLIADELGCIRALCRNEHDDCVHGRLASEEMSALLGEFQGFIEPRACGGATQKILYPKELREPMRRAHAATNLLNVFFGMMRASRQIAAPKRIDQGRILREIEDRVTVLEDYKDGQAQGLGFMADLCAAGGQPGSAALYAGAAVEKARDAALLRQMRQAARAVGVDEPPPGPRPRGPGPKRRSGEPGDRWVTQRIFRELQAMVKGPSDGGPSLTMWTAKFATVVLGKPISRMMVRGWTRA